MSHLTDPKKKLYISNTEEKKEILIPIYFTKNDLYSYLSCLGEMIIFYNNNILKNDLTSIEDIPNNSTILLFSIPFYKDYRKSSLYKYILSLYPNNILYNILCKKDTGVNYIVILPENISVYLMVTLIRKILLLNQDFGILNNGVKIYDNNNAKLKDFFKGNFSPLLSLYEFNSLPGFSSFTGGEIKIIIFLKNKEVFKSIIMHKYSPICDIYKYFDNGEISKIFINGLLISKDDHHSLASFGIKGDFCCIAE